MARKLPKATAQTLDDLRRETGTPTKPAKRPRRAASAAKPRKKPAAPAAAPTPASKAAPVPAPVPMPTVAPDATIDLETRYRQSRAHEIVGRYTTYSAIGGLLPFPFIDTASVMACIYKMVQALATHYDAAFLPDRTRTALAALVGGLGQSGAGAVTAAALAKAVPGPGFYASAISSIASAALTRAIGRAFIMHFETGGTAVEYDPAVLRKYFDRFREDEKRA